MKSTGLLVLVLAAAFASVAGCSFALDGYSGGAVDAGTTEGGADAADGGTDASSDVGPADGATDGPAILTLFSDDFERADVKGAWDEVATDPDSRAQLTSDTPHGGARGLRIELATKDDSVATVLKTLPTVSHVRLTYWLRFASAPSRGANLPGFALHLPAGRDVNLFLTMGSAGSVDVAVQQFNASAFFFSSGERPAPVGRWFSVELELDAAAGTYRASLDGTVAVSTRAVGVPVAPASITISGGSSYAKAGPAFSFLVDDVRLEALP